MFFHLNELVFQEEQCSTLNSYQNFLTIIYTDTCNRKKNNSKNKKKQREHLIFFCLFHGHFQSYYIAGHNYVKAINLYEIPSLNINEDNQLQIQILKSIFILYN